MASSEMERLLAFRRGLQTDADAPIITGGASIDTSDLLNAIDSLIDRYGDAETVLYRMVETGDLDNVHQEFCALAGLGADTIDDVWTSLKCEALTDRLTSGEAL